MLAEQLMYWIKERESIREKKERGDPKPWTEDHILKTYKFCNVHREDDKVSRWIADNWRAPNNDDPMLWFNMVLARLINWPETLAEVGYGASIRDFLAITQARKLRGDKVFSAAYIVSTNGMAMDKLEYLAKLVLEPLWKNRSAVAPREDEPLADFHRRLMQFNGMGSFLAAQVVADLKYVEPLIFAEDWASWAASGPGSRRGLNRVLERKVTAAWPERHWHESLLYLKDDVDAEFAKLGWEPLHAQDLQNCLCEFDKYERARKNEGRPKALYPGVCHARNQRE